MNLLAALFDSFGRQPGFGLTMFWLSPIMLPLALAFTYRNHSTKEN